MFSVAGCDSHGLNECLLCSHDSRFHDYEYYGGTLHYR